MVTARASREEISRVTGPAVAPLLFTDGVQVLDDAVWLWVVIPLESTQMEEDPVIFARTWANAQALAQLLPDEVPFTIRCVWSDHSSAAYRKTWENVDSVRAPGMDHYIDLGAHRIDKGAREGTYREWNVVLGIRLPNSGESASNRRAARKLAREMRSSAAQQRGAAQRVQTLAPVIAAWFQTAGDTRFRAYPAPAGLMAWSYSRELRSTPIPVPDGDTIGQSVLAGLADGVMDPTQSRDYVVVTDNVSGRSRYVSILVPAARTGISAEDLSLPGGEWVQIAQEFRDVDVIIHGLSYGTNISVEMIDKALKVIREQIDSAQSVGIPTSDELLQGERSLTERRNQLLRRLDGEATIHPRWVVRAGDPAELKSKVKRVIQRYANIVELIVVPSIQDLLWKEILPGDHVRVPEFGQDMPLRSLAGSWFHAGSPLGDDTGPYAGGNGGETPGPVQVHFTLRTKLGKGQPTTMVFTGKSRAGKSTSLMLAVLGMLGEGAWVLLVDNKGDLGGIIDTARSTFVDYDEDGQTVVGRIKVQVLTMMDPDCSGRMDPMRFAPDADSARNLTVTAFLGVLNSDDRRRGETVIENAIAQVLTRDRSQWSSPAVIEALTATTGDDARAATARELADVLRTRAQTPQIRAVLGPAVAGQEPIMTDRGLVFVDTAGMDLPQDSPDPDQWTPVQRCAMTAMRMVMAYGTLQSRGVRTRNKVVAITEMHLWTGYSDFRGFLEWLARAGAALKTYLLLDTQAALDLAKMTGLLEQIVMAFCFLATGKEEQLGQATLLGRPNPGPKLLGKLGELTPGGCIMRDRRNRIGKLQWDLLTKTIMSSLDTNAGDDIEDQPATAPTNSTTTADGVTGNDEASGGSRSGELHHSPTPVGATP